MAAGVALLAALPGALALPPLDRDEARYAEATAQMLETGDFVTIHFQDAPRLKKPIGVYWLQAAAVSVVSRAESREIWAYRLPSMLGAMLAAAACVWGAASFLSPGSAFAAGAMLATSFMLSTEAAIAATDAVLCGATTLAMAALCRLYLALRGGATARRRTKVLFWVGLTLSVLVKGPIGPMVVALCLLALCAWDRKAAWVRRLGWGWGLIIMAGIVGPWALAITVATDGAFWTASLGHDLAAKIAGGSEGHGEPPGFYLLLFPLLMFPAVLLAPAGALTAWRERAEPGVRFALCWLIPSWLVFEAAPTKLIHYVLPLLGAAAWLMARALEARKPPPPKLRLAELAWVRWVGGGLCLAMAAVFASIGIWAMSGLDDASGAFWAYLAAALFFAAAGGGAVFLWLRRPALAVVCACVLAALGHGAVAGGLAPALRPLWLSTRAADLLVRVGASPWQGLTPSPVAVTGYAEPSIVFLLGADTQLGGVEDAADAIAEHRPALVEAAVVTRFKSELADRGLRAREAGRVSGLDYSNGRRETLVLFLGLNEGTKRK